MSYKPKVHFLTPGDDKTQCGWSGPNILFDENPENVNCQRCHTNLRKIDGKWWLDCTYYDSCTGCFESEDGQPMGGGYRMHKKHHCYVGHGCLECGGHGVTKRVVGVPIDEMRPK